MKTKLTRADRKFIDKVDHMNHKQIHQLKLEKYIGHRYWEHLRVPKLSWDLKPLFYINDITYKIPKKNHKGYYTRKHYKGELVLIRIKSKDQFDCYWRIRLELMDCSSTEWKDTVNNTNDMPCIHYSELMSKKRNDIKKRVLAAKGINPKKPKRPKSNDDNNDPSNNGLNNNKKRPNPDDNWVTKAMNMKL